jgi:hypothetical protein
MSLLKAPGETKTGPPWDSWRIIRRNLWKRRFKRRKWREAMRERAARTDEVEGEGQQPQEGEKEVENLQPVDEFQEVASEALHSASLSWENWISWT